MEAQAVTPDMPVAVTLKSFGQGRRWVRWSGGERGLGLKAGWFCFLATMVILLGANNRFGNC